MPTSSPLDKEGKVGTVFARSEVAAALDLVVDVTLDRVLKTIQDLSYGLVEGKGDDGNPIVRQVVDMKDITQAINEMREKS